jgi:phage-related minor tail protein
MNPETVDSEYAKVQQAASQVTQAIQDLAAKLQAAATTNPDAREWLLDLKSVALQVQQEQLSVQSMLQAVHDFTVDHLAQSQQAYQQPQPQYAQPSQYQPQYAPQPTYQTMQGGGGGLLSRFMGGGFGRAIATGAGFAIGDDVINNIF